MNQYLVVLKKKWFKKKKIRNAIMYLILSIVSLYLIFPYIFMLLRSFMPSSDFTILPVKFFPSYFSFEGYIKMFAQHNYFTYTMNTLKIVVFNIIAVPISASFCAYGFAKLKFIGKKQLFAMVLATIMIPGAITQVPLYVIFSSLKWTESALPMTIPSLFGGGAVNIFLCMQYMKNISNEIENAAKIDGADSIKRYFSIMLPLSLPILLFIAVGSFSSSWSDFYGPLIYLKTQNNYTLALAIYYDSISTNVSLSVANIRMAAGVFMTIPPIILFFFYQDTLIDGIAVGAVKG